MRDVVAAAWLQCLVLSNWHIVIHVSSVAFKIMTVLFDVLLWFIFIWMQGVWSEKIVRAIFPLSFKFKIFQLIKRAGCCFERIFLDFFLFFVFMSSVSCVIYWDTRLRVIISRGLNMFEKSLRFIYITPAATLHQPFHLVW